MYSCCHEQGDDPYASGNENRRRNRDRLNEQITAHNFLRRIRGYGHGLSFGGPRGMPGGMFGFGPRGQPPFSGHRGHPRLPSLSGQGRQRPLFSVPFCYDDDSDSDDDMYPSPWLPQSPSWYGTTTTGMQRPRLWSTFDGCYCDLDLPTSFSRYYDD